MPDQVPEKRRIVVTLIIHPSELPGLRPGFNPGSRNIEPGPGKKQSVFAELTHSGHTGESVDPGPPHPLKEEGFQPVILVMRGEDDIKLQLTRRGRESPVAFFSCRRLKPLPLPVHADLVGRERNAAGVAERPAGGFPGVGIFRNAVIHVKGIKAFDQAAPAAGPCQSVRGLKKRHGVAAA